MAKTIFDGGTLTLTATGGPYTFYLTSMKYDDKVAKVDATDTGSASNSKEFIFSTREEQSASFEMWAQLTTTGSHPYTDYIKVGTVYSGSVLNFEAISLTKTLVFESVEVSATVDNVVKLTATAVLT